MPNVVTVKCNFIICYGPYNNKTPDRPFEEIGDSLGIFGMLDIIKTETESRNQRGQFAAIALLIFLFILLFLGKKDM